MGYFIIKPTSNDGFMFDLVADNNEIIATSQTYKSVENAKIGIESIKTNCSAPVEDRTIAGFEELPCSKFEIFKDVEDKFRFHLKASNGEIIAASQGYTSKESCRKGIESVKHNAPGAEIKKGY